MKWLPLDSDDRALLDAAARAIRENYDHPRHTVGAAVRCSSGAVYTGVNVESCGYGPCAEPIAIGAAITAGERELEAIVAVGGPAGARLLSPCGNCRQLVADYAPDAYVILERDGGPAKIRAGDLLPEPYRNFD